MAICKWCEREMLDESVKTCNGNDSVDYPDGISLPPIPYENSYGRDDELAHPGHQHRCHDCGVALGGMHHPGCDMERCPRCGGQLISCGCLDEPDDDTWDGVISYGTDA